MGTALERNALGDATVEVLKKLHARTGVSLRALSRESGVKLTRLGDILQRGRVINIDELDLICRVFSVRVSVVVAAAEWATTGKRPILEDEDVDWEQIYELALLANPDLPRDNPAGNVTELLPRKNADLDALEPFA